MRVCVCQKVGPLCNAVGDLCRERLRAGLRQSRGRLSVGHRARGSHVLLSWWHSDLALDRHISSMHLPASTPVPSLSMASINDKSPRGL